MGRVAATLRSLTGRGPRTSALLRSPEEVAPVAEPVEAVAAVEELEAPPPSGEDAAALIDAARARLRATIARPADDDPT